jgi:hypothetical protein
VQRLYRKTVLPSNPGRRVCTQTPYLLSYPARFEGVSSRFLNAAGANPMFLTLVVVLGVVMVSLFAAISDTAEGDGF